MATKQETDTKSPMTEQASKEKSLPSDLPAKQLLEVVERIRPFVANLWQARKPLMYINGGIVVVTVLILVLLVKPYYESVVTILPNYGSTTALSGLSQLATLVGTGGGAPTDIYQNLIVSEAVLEQVIISKYQTEAYADSVNLLDYFQVDPDTRVAASLQERSRLIQFLKTMTQDVMTLDLDVATNILTVTVRMPESKLSADVANMIAASLDKYIRTKRISTSSNQRIYLETRLAVLKDSLTGAEESLRNFSARNRVVNESPELVLERGRLTRNVQILESIFEDLSRQLELAKMDEEKDIPILNIKEPAGEPLLKAGPNRRLIFVVILFLSGTLSCGYFLFKPEIERLWAIVKDTKWT